MQAGPKMRLTTQGYAWWCPACREMHPLPDGWTFDGNLERPTFSPSFKHGPAIAIVKDESGEWVGRWFARDVAGNLVERVGLQPGDVPVMWCCHYIITAGQVAYCPDCTHEMKNTTIAMPDLPPALQDTGKAAGCS
jgi:hypothetical protein